METATLSKYPLSLDLSKNTVAWIKQIHPKTLPPIGRKELAVYKSLEAGGIDPLVRESWFAHIDAPDVAIEGSYSFVDPNNPMQGPILCKNISRTEAVPETRNGVNTGQVLNKENIEPLIFNLGVVGVTIRTDIVKYIFMELHPLNADNPYRDKTKTAAFYREDLHTKGMVTSALEVDMGLDAGNEVRKMSHKDVLAFAAAVNPPIPTSNRQAHEIKADLTRFAMNNPRQFMSLVRNADKVIEFVVAEAQDQGLIAFDTKTRSWSFFGAQAPFFEASKIEGNPVLGLVKYLGSDEAKDDLEFLEGQIGYWKPREIGILQ